jgi:aldose 1-epimerase
LSHDLQNSSLSFKSDQKIKFDENLITQKVIDEKTEKEFKIEKKQLDDCFILNSNTIGFKTPNYQLEISTNQIKNYVQLYTPENLPLIAIEPMTGVSNSFNNGIGLQVLQPNTSFSLKWNVKIK